jgi:RNA polymerase sigma factor (TIGR02999 family)
VSETSEDYFERLELDYEELIRIAQHWLRREDNHTLLLEPCDLVHEAYLRLKKSHVQYRSRKHYFALWSRKMRQILIDASRRAKAQKRGNGCQRVDLHQVDIACHVQSVNLLGLDQVLSRLRKSNPRQGKIVELKSFGELSIREIATLLHVAEGRVRRDWAVARNWLRAEIERSDRGLESDGAAVCEPSVQRLEEYSR